MIIDLQRRLAEVGRIRIGQQVQSSNGKTRPARLESFRLTSPDRRRIEQAAALYGGSVEPWDAPAGKQWQVVTDAQSLNVVVPPSDMCFTQSYELWSAGGCRRRCNGVTESISDGPCVCDPENRECAIHTRLSVMLADMPGLGVWRLDTQGYYAAVELQGAVEVIRLAAGCGKMLPARLLLQQRMAMRPDSGTRRFAVPVLDIEVSPAQLLSGAAALDAGTIAVEPAQAAAPALTPVPKEQKQRQSVAEQVNRRRERKTRSQQPIPPTGLEPRTVEEADTAGDAVTKPQLQKLSILRQKHGYPDTDQGRVDWFARVHSIVGRTVASNKELTKAEASVLIDVLVESGDDEKASRQEG